MDDALQNNVELSLEEKDIIQEEESVQYLQDNFTFNDFWKFGPTRTILKNEFIQVFNDTAGAQISQFYLMELDKSKYNESSILAFDRDGIKRGTLESMVYNHIVKDYDIEMFYQNPEWARPLVVYHLENDRVEVKPEFVVPKKAMRTFNWVTKNYT